MSRATPQMTVGVARDADGDLYLPAHQVTGLLRRLAGQWQDWAEDDLDPHLDQVTVDQLTAALRELADQIDVECIARTHNHHQDEEEGER